MPVGSLSLTPEQKAILDSLPKLHFGVYSTTTTAIGTDPDNPTYIEGLVLSPTSSSEFELIQDANLDYWVKYNGDRTISVMTGTVSYQVDNGTGGTAQLNLWSERTDDDGVTFTENDNSLRDSEVSNTSASSQTKFSGVVAWVSGEAIRFAGYNGAGGNLTLAAPTATVNGGNAISGYSFIWTLIEP